MWIELAKFHKLGTERTVRLKYGNFLVALHTRFTPNTSTGTVLNEICLEQLRLMQRNNEFAVHAIFDNMIELGKVIDPEQTWVTKSKEVENIKKVNYE